MTDTGNLAKQVAERLAAERAALAEVRELASEVRRLTDVRRKLRRRIYRAAVVDRVEQYKLAEAAGISRQYVHDIVKAGADDDDSAAEPDAA